MDCLESCDKLNNKLQLDQSKLKDKQEELSKLNCVLRSVEERWQERKQLLSQINEKTKTIELLCRRVKTNFDTFPSQIDDLDAYTKQVLQNKHKFEVPINEFQKSLDDSLSRLNDQIGQKINAIKTKYRVIIDKLQVKKEHVQQLTNASLDKYEQLRSDLNEANQTIVRLEDEIKNKQNLELEYAAEKIRVVEQCKQLELKTESTLKANQSIVEEIAQLNVQFKKAEEDKQSIESKIKMQDELIDCTRLMIQELENNISSNQNYQQYKGEYDELEEQIRQLESEYEDRTRIYQMKAHCRELKERKIEQVRKILDRLKAVEAAEHLDDSERDAQYESVLGEIQNEIKFLENELESKGLTSQLNASTQQVSQVNLITQPTQQQQALACEQTKDDQSRDDKSRDDQSTAGQLKADEQQNAKVQTDKFEVVPTELRGYLYDTKAILFGSQDEKPEVENELAVDKENRSDEVNQPISSTEPDTTLQDCLFTSSYGLDEFTNPIIPEIFTSSIPQSNERTPIANDRQQANTQTSSHHNESASLQVSQSTSLINRDRAFLSNSSAPSKDSVQFKTPTQSGGREQQTKEASKRKNLTDGANKTKRKRKN